MRIQPGYVGQHSCVGLLSHYQKQANQQKRARQSTHPKLIGRGTPGGGRGHGRSDDGACVLAAEGDGALSAVMGGWALAATSATSSATVVEAVATDRVPIGSRNQSVRLMRLARKWATSHAEPTLNGKEGVDSCCTSSLLTIAGHGMAVSWHGQTCSGLASYPICSWHQTKPRIEARIGARS